MDRFPDIDSMDRRGINEVKRNYARYYETLKGDGSREARILRHAIRQWINHDNPEWIKAIGRLNFIPVTIDEFIESPEFLGDLMHVWPVLREDLRRINPDIFAGEPPKHEMLLGGATGTGKTICAQITCAYQAYVLCCFDDPQALFGLNKTTPIVFIFQSARTSINRRVIYQPFRDLFLSMPFVRENVEHNREIESSLILHHGRIHIVKEVASVQALLSQAVIGGILDEVNFMAVIEDSKQTIGGGLGGMYDQAETLYNTLSRRRAGRFITRGPSPGSVCVISSINYKGDFLDRRISQIEETGQRGSFVARHRQYEVQPQDKFCGKRFRLLCGTEEYGTRVLKNTEKEGKDYPEGARVESVPIEYLQYFITDPENAIRDIVGIASGAQNPFITRRDKIILAVRRWRATFSRNLLRKSDVQLVRGEFLEVDERALPPIEDRRLPHYMHIDLSKTQDRCGIGLTREGKREVTYYTDEGDSFEMLPTFVVVMAASIEPNPQAPLDIADIRKFAFKLIYKYEFNIEKITFDGFQSHESITAFRKKGIRSGELSVDRTSEPYKYFRSCVYQERISLPDSELLRFELANLLYDAQKDKIDHPPKGSKDVSDGVAGSVFSAAKSRSVRNKVVSVGNSPRKRERPRTRRREPEIPQQVADSDIEEDKKMVYNKPEGN